MGGEHDRATCLFQKASSGTWCRMRAVRGAAAVLLTQTRVSGVRRWDSTHLKAHKMRKLANLNKVRSLSYLRVIIPLGECK